jgi:plastocyanin
MRPFRFFVALTILGLVTTVPILKVAAQAGTTVNVVNFDYLQRQVTVDVGTTVTWHNTADRPHTATDRGGTFDTNPVLPGQSSSIRFSVPGTYFYFCRINPSKMNGVITVQPAAQPSTVNRIQAVDPANIIGETFRFDPSTLTVPAGSTLLFANAGGKPHTLTADDGSFGTGVVTPGAEGGRFAGGNASVVLNKPGTFSFHCEIHPQLMKGELTVSGGAQSGPSPPSVAPQQGSVKIVDFAFNPAQVSVAPGGVISFKNTGSASHTATFDDVPLDTNVIRPGENGTLKAPAKPGSYSYHCNIHPARMRGVLVVVGQNVQDPTRYPTQAAAIAKVGGPGRGVSWLALVTGVVAAFLGGLGIAPFLRGRKEKPV